MFAMRRCPLLARHRRRRNRSPRALSQSSAGVSCNSTCPFTGPDNAIEMDALVRAIPAGNVAQVAADARLLVDVRHNLVIQIQVLPLGHLGNREPAEILDRRESLRRIQFSSPSAMSSTMR